MFWRASACIGLSLLVGSGGTAHAKSLPGDLQPLVQSSCLACHTGTAVAPFDMAALDFDLADPHTFRAWERVYDRIERGEMPPPPMPTPDAALLDPALKALKEALVEANLAASGEQRAPLRRLTRLEYGYTIQDLLWLDEAVGAALGQSLPAEADSGGFDTVAAKQGISPLHVRSYLAAADRALDAAIVTGPKPKPDKRVIEYAKSGYLNFMHDAKILGGGITKVVEGEGGAAVAMFFDSGSTYLMHTESENYHVPAPGRYRITMEAWGYQADTPVTLTLYRGTKQGSSAQLSELLGAFDLAGDVPRTVSVAAYLRPGDLLSPSVADLVRPEGDYINYYAPDKNVKDYPGEGIAIKTLAIEGPMVGVWPPKSTRQLLPGVAFDENGEVQLSKAPEAHILEIVDAFASRAFRRPLADGEAESYASLAEPILAEGRPFLEAVRVPLRAILSAPPFLYQTAAPGKLDDFALASRLSYFLWRSMPDETLLELAREGSLGEPDVLAAQVERMLDDAKTERFVKDFAGQAFRLYELKATNPDAGLYPEYDDRLGQAMAWETQLFLAELIAQDLGVGHLVDADFTFLNRRLAEHYDVPDVDGQWMRKVALPADSPRGGLLTQASIHKITANGTVTSPVPRGNFVLANLLGRPAPPPPPGIEGLEPDTRGTTTVREQLNAHRENIVCASCHQSIDPPGFALESFDPIGGFRANYRVSGGEMQFGDFTVPAPYKEGPVVDASGVTPDGHQFANVAEYQALLLREEIEAIARHFVSQLLVFGTGAEIGFADRDQVQRIAASVADRSYPVRSLIHEVAQSDLFRSR